MVGDPKALFLSGFISKLKKSFLLHEFHENNVIFLKNQHYPYYFIISHFSKIVYQHKPFTWNWGIETATVIPRKDFLHIH